MKSSNFIVKPDPRLPSMYVVNRVGKGVVPKVLSGQFTSPSEAWRHVDKYEENQDGRKGNSSSRDK